MTSSTAQNGIGKCDTWLAKPEQGAACAIIAEVAQAHDGSLGMAHAFIDSAARCGADAIKFQTHIAASESTRAEPWLRDRDLARRQHRRVGQS